MRNAGEKGAEADHPSPGPAPLIPSALLCILALLSAVRINGDGQEILYLAEGDNVRLGCPYILDPEDYVLMGWTLSGSKSTQTLTSGECGKCWVRDSSLLHTQ